MNTAASLIDKFARLFASDDDLVTETNGISPKVKAFGVTLTIPGVILLALGIILQDDVLRSAGITALAGAGVGAGAGYVAPPGKVSGAGAVQVVGPPSDSMLSTEALSELEHAEE